MRKSTMNQLYDVFDDEKGKEKVVALCHSVPEDLSNMNMIYLNDVVMQRKDGTLVHRKMITTQATKIIDLRPVCVIIDTPYLIYLCLKPGNQNYDQDQLKKVLILDNERSHVSAEMTFVPAIYWGNDGKYFQYIDFKAGELKKELYDRFFNFGIVEVAVKVKRTYAEAHYDYKIAVEGDHIFYPQIG